MRLDIKKLCDIVFFSINIKITEVIESGVTEV